VGEALLITLREGFEASLIVAILFAAVRRSDRPALSRWIWIGTGAAVAVSIALGVALHLTIDDLTGIARLRTFALICLAAAALLTWMIFWMRGHARSLTGELEGQVQRAMNQSVVALALVAFVSVARVGLETAVVLVSPTTASEGGEVLVGGLIGLAIAVALGVGVYHGSRVIPMRIFFQVTGVLIILFAAGLLSRSVQFFQAAGDLGTANNAAYDVTGAEWLTTSTESGRVLAGILGWDPRPSIEQVVVYVGYLAPVLVAFFRTPRTRGRRRVPVPAPTRETAAG
jgi:high-affinity iron transporter